MRKGLYLLLLCSMAACQKQSDDLPAKSPVIKKIELHIHTSETYTQPLLDSVSASVTISICRLNSATATPQVIWDTAFASRPLKRYPLLPQKHVIKKQLSVCGDETLQVFYNIRYKYKGLISETGNAGAAVTPFTFIDVEL